MLATSLLFDFWKEQLHYLLHIPHTSSTVETLVLILAAITAIYTQYNRNLKSFSLIFTLIGEAKIIFFFLLLPYKIN
jgi:hypothetical protein